MGRKKIEIKLIKNQRLRNITYNKRKRGLLKKLVELSIICGIKAKLEMKDSMGNLIVVDAGNRDQQMADEVPKDKVFVFTQADYPEFKGFEKIKKRNMDSISDELYDESEQSSNKNIRAQVRQRRNQSRIEVETLVQPEREEQPETRSDFKLIQQSPPIAQTVQPTITDSSANQTMEYLMYVQSVQLKAQLQYAEMQYRSLLSRFMNGQL